MFVLCDRDVGDLKFLVFVVDDICFGGHHPFQSIRHALVFWKVSFFDILDMFLITMISLQLLL